MARQNFMRQLLSGFQSSYLQSGKGFRQEQAEVRETERQQEQNLFEQRQVELKEEQALQKAEQEKSMIGALLQPGIDRKTYTQGYLQLSKEGRNQLGDLKQELDPAAKTKIIGGNLYRIDPKTGIPDETPIMEAEPRVVNAAWGIQEETGKYGFFRMFDDGSSDFTDPGRKEPVKTTGKGKTEVDTGPQSFDDYTTKQFNTALNQFTADINKIEAKRQKVSELKEFYGDDIAIQANINTANTLASNAEKSVYALMPPSTREYVDSANARMEAAAKKAGLSTQAFMDKHKESFLQNFIRVLTPLWENDEMDDKEYRALSAWAQFKYGYIAEDK